MALDTKIAQYSRSKTGASGPPPTTGLGAADAGLLAVNFAGHDAADKTAGNVAIYSWDGGAWEHLNKTAAVTTQTIDLTTGGAAAAANIGAAYAVGSPPLTGDVIIATYGTPTPGAFLLTNKAAPGTAASWTSLGSATATASATDASTGTDNLKMITSSVLRTELTRLLAGATPMTGAITTKTAGTAGDANKILVLGAGGKLPAGAVNLATAAEMTAGTEAAHLVTPKLIRDELVKSLGIADAKLTTGGVAIATGGGVAGVAGQLVKLGATGLIDPSFFSIKTLNFIGAADFTGAIPAAPGGGFSKGDVYFNNAKGAPAAAWGFDPSVTAVAIGDMTLYDGTKWHHLATAADLSGAVMKIGSNAMAADATLVWTAPTVNGTVIVDGASAAKSVVQNVTLKTCVIDCGTF